MSLIQHRSVENGVVLNLFLKVYQNLNSTQSAAAVVVAWVDLRDSTHLAGSASHGNPKVRSALRSRKGGRVVHWQGPPGPGSPGLSWTNHRPGPGAAT
jgi:hypothetical protein